jgi:hypothetical protein
VLILPAPPPLSIPRQPPGPYHDVAAHVVRWLLVVTTAGGDEGAGVGRCLTARRPLMSSPLAAHHVPAPCSPGHLHHGLPSHASNRAAAAVETGRALSARRRPLPEVGLRGNEQRFPLGRAGGPFHRSAGRPSSAPASDERRGGGDGAGCGG